MKITKLTCKRCKNEFESNNKNRLFCDKCNSEMTNAERYDYYNKNCYSNFIDHRVCINCGKEWEVVRRPLRGYTSKIQRFCHECSKKLSENEKKEIRIKKIPGYREHLNEAKRKCHRTHVEKHILTVAKRRAKIKNLDFNLELSDIVIPKICPILEVPLVCGTKGNYEYTPSIDRIDNSKGYIKGNIRIISKKANSMKNSATIEELKAFCKNILRYSLNNTEEECIESKDKEL